MESMEINKNRHLILAVTGASGSYAAQALIEKSYWPVDIIISNWGKHVMKHEHVDVDILKRKISRQFSNNDLFALPSSGSIPTIGMVILPCSAKTLGEIANCTGGNLISRAAHCHLKEQRPLIICLRETPLTVIDIGNMKRISDAGGILMPICPPFFMFGKRRPQEVIMSDLLDAFANRVLSLLGQKLRSTWESVK